MCGLYGFIDSKNVLTEREKVILANCLALQSTARGTDGTGFATLSSKGLVIRKSAKSADRFSPKSLQSKIFLGHTRLATSGSIDDESAHPFLSRCGKWALAHNGVAFEDYIRIRSLIRDLDTDVDSEGMVRFLERTGFEAQALYKFYRFWRNSGFAITILDQKKRALVFFRNSNNTAFYIKLPNGLIVYASTRAILLNSLAQAGIYADEDNIKEFASHKRYEISEAGTMSVQMITNIKTPDNTVSLADIIKYYENRTSKARTTKKAA